MVASNLQEHFGDGFQRDIHNHKVTYTTFLNLAHATVTMKMLTPKYAIKSKHTRHVIPGRCCRVNRCLSAVIRSDNNRKREASRVRARARARLESGNRRADARPLLLADGRRRGGRRRARAARPRTVLPRVGIYFLLVWKKGKRRKKTLSPSHRNQLHRPVK